MSIKSTDSKVQSVSGIAVASMAAAGVVVAASVISGIARFLSSSGRKVYNEAVRTLPTIVDEIKAFNTTGLNSVTRPSKETMSNDVDLAKGRFLAHLASARLFTDDPDGLKKQLAMVQSATSLKSLAAAESGVLEFIGNSHNLVFLKSLSTACMRASSKIGFGQVATELAKDGTSRIIGSDAAGRAVVTEISRDNEGGFSIATEVVGVIDGSCNQILDAFDEALANEGVRRSPGKKDFTGGVCELSAAREFLRRKVMPASKQKAAQESKSKTDSGISRTRILNTRPSTKQR